MRRTTLKNTGPAQQQELAAGLLLASSRLVFFVVIFLALVLATPAPVDAATLSSPGTMTSGEYATRLYRRLTGRVPSVADRQRMEQLIRAGDLMGAAEVAVNADEFYNVSVVRFAAPLSSRSDETRIPLNDMIAMFVGTTRDDRDARELLYGDFTYIGNAGHPEYECKEGNCAFSFNDPKPHFDYLDRKKVNLRKFLIRQSPQWPQLRVSDSAGVLTSDTWGRIHINGGTNRRAVEFAFKQFLCSPMASMMDTRLPEDYYNRIARDIDRSPGGDPKIFQNQCRGCHLVMDPLRGAFAYFDMPDGAVGPAQKSGVVPKMNRNAEVYPPGFVTMDNSWFNYATQNQNVALGWRGAMSGRGAREFGQMLSNSMAFSRCMATRVWRHVCLSEPTEVDAKLAATLGQQFEEDGYRLRSLFKRVVTHPSCIGKVSIFSKGTLSTPVNFDPQQIQILDGGGEP